MLGNFVLQGADYDRYYIKACAVRKQLKAEIGGVLNECDALIGPTTPTTAFKRGSRNSCSDGSEDIFTVLANLTGNPAISVPCGTDENGLPIGLQITGRNYDEKTLYSFAQLLEEEAKL
jgi:aspartyl-tRNA(Asn)/glutamyl-tRNA(Gln) amidotransferase subunit A